MGSGESTPSRVLLVGFMAAGKTTVGRMLARMLDWPFLDFDRAVEARVGASVPEIFARRGEAFFRAEEARVGRELLARDRVVLASGGGWPEPPGRMEALGPDTLSVWLRVSAEEAIRRAGAEHDVRPLLAGESPEATVRELLGRRTPRYALATLTLDTDGTEPRSLARVIAARVRRSVPESNRTGPHDPVSLAGGASNEGPFVEESGSNHP